MKRKRIFGLFAKGPPAIISCLSSGAMQEGHIGDPCVQHQRSRPMDECTL